MNSLVSQNEVVLERPVNESQDLKSAAPEPMDTMSGSEPGNCTSPLQAMESTTNPSTPAMPGDMVEDSSGPLTVQEVELICDLFYLPCEHGPKAIEILTEFYWLKTHAGVMLADCDRVSSTTTVGEEGVEVGRPEWVKRKEKFVDLVQDMKRAFEKICSAPNRELVYNLYTYLWDMVGVVFMLLSYIDWLAMGRFSPKYQQLIIGRHTWFSGIREAFQSGDHEPWVFRGGHTWFSGIREAF